MIKRITLSALAIIAATAPAFAHINPLEHGSFLTGIAHPLFGLDHVLVMVAVGLWAASLGGKAMLTVPAAFVGAMALGFVASAMGAPLPFVEPVILASVIFVGIMVALALPIPAAGVSAVVAFFALFHGSAHGTELAAATAWQFAAGFVIATAALHGVGIALGLALNKVQAKAKLTSLTRIAGAATAIAGLGMMFAG